MANATEAFELPPLPSYTLTLRPSLVPGIPDKYLSLVLPIIAYWAFSMVFHFIDTRDYFPQYRLHTPAEVLKRNHVSRWEVVRDVIIQQVVQTVVGAVLAAFDEEDYLGKDDYNVTVWAQRVRLAQRALPAVLGAIGLDSQALALKVSKSSPAVAGLLAGGRYSISSSTAAPAFASWEMTAAKIVYWVLDPAVRFALAILIVDTWQYFLHRAMHMNKWLYTTFHSRHHRLYVPYAYGALYNHPFEGFLLDTLGTGLAYLIVGLSPRQAMCFFTGSTIKTVDDHCGYALPWDPLQHVTSNNAGYHDVHHQSWGIKTNFSQPFFTFWDRALGTVWTGGDVSARYERARKAAEKKTSADAAREQTRSRSVSTNSSGEKSSERRPSVPIGKAFAQAAASRDQTMQDAKAASSGSIPEEAAEEAEVRVRAPKARKRTLPSSTSQAGTLKALRDRMGCGVLGYDGTR